MGNSTEPHWRHIGPDTAPQPCKLGGDMCAKKDAATAKHTNETEQNLQVRLKKTTEYEMRADTRQKPLHKSILTLSTLQLHTCDVFNIFICTHPCA